MEKELNIIVVGANGRMGREIISVIEETQGVSFYAGVDRAGEGKWSSLTSLDSKKVDVAIDFSTVENMGPTIEWCSANQVSYVSGVTGVGQSHMETSKIAAKKIPVLWSPNMSLGVNIFIDIIEKLGSTTKGYDLQLEEFHHNKKVDVPSGTAKLLQETLEKSSGKKLPPVLAGRGGGIFGIHKLWMMGEEETLTIEHTALNRRVFARGAVQSAIWLSRQKPGLYQIRDMWK